MDRPDVMTPDRLIPIELLVMLAIIITLIIR